MITYILLCQGEYQNILTLDIGDHNIVYVFVSKGTQVACVKA